MTDRQITETGLIFYGAAEYWSYLGLHDGYYRTDEVDPYEEVHTVPLPWTETGTECQECYLFGYFLGKEIKEDEQEEKERKAKAKEIVQPVIRPGESKSGFDGPWDAVE